MRPEALARAHLKARNLGFAEGTARQAVEKQPNQVVPLAALVEILHAVGKDDEARKEYAKLQVTARAADRDVPVFQRLAPVVAGWRSGETGTAKATDTDTADDTGPRIDLTTVGPLSWSPWGAASLDGTDTDGKPWSLESRRGRNVVVLFFLGGKCAHCMQQLQLFGKAQKELAALDTDLVAIGTDDIEATLRPEAEPRPDRVPDADAGRPGARPVQALRGVRRI